MSGSPSCTVSEAAAKSGPRSSAASGCSAAGGKIVRLTCTIGDGSKPPRSLEVDCPVCGYHHLVKPIWRKPTERDQGRAGDLVVEPVWPKSHPKAMPA